MSSPRALLAEGISRLAAGGVPEPRADAEWLLSHVLGCRRLEVYGKAETSVPSATLQRFERLITERLSRRPLAYLLGEWEFFGLSFEVTPDVLIPRPETELVVETCFELLRSRRGRSCLLPDASLSYGDITTQKATTSPFVMDVGTGCGNIAVALAATLPEVQVIAIDKSEAALAVAHRNIVRHGVGNRIHLAHGDFLLNRGAGGSEWGGSEASVDLIVSNPPYVTTGELKTLAPEVRQEPREALEGGEDGLSVIRPLLIQASKWLVPGGWLVCEIAASQETPALALAAQTGFISATVRRDLAGNPRVLLARKPHIHG